MSDESANDRTAAPAPGSGPSSPFSGAPNFNALIATILTDKASERYVIGDVIARGGMGAIHDVRDCNSRRDVVMKVVLPNKRVSIPTILRFIREAQITAQLEHPNIVPVYELGLDSGGDIYYTMKKVHGTTLRDVLNNIRLGDLTTIEAYPLVRLLTIFQRVGDAIAYAHSKGVVHRDLKPENIMIGNYGEVLVLDWGLAKVIGCDSSNPNINENVCQSQFFPGAPQQPSSTGDKVTCIDSDIESTYLATLEGRIMGTPAYLSPEQARGVPSEISNQSDIYALGGILYSILTLDIPISGMSPKTVIAKVLRGEIDSPETYNARRGIRGDQERPAKKRHILYHCPGRRIPSSLSAVTMKAMNLNPAERYQTVEELQDDIAKYQHGFATVAEGAGALKLIVLLIKRNRLWAVFLLVTLLLGSGFILQVVYSEREARRLQNLAEQGEQIARKNVFITKEAGKRAQLRFAETLIAQGNAMAQLNQWDIAKINYVEAFHVIGNLDQSTYAVELRLWEAFGKSPPLLWARTDLAQLPLSMAVSADGLHTLTGNDDGSVTVWDNITGQALSIMQPNGPAPPWRATAIHPAGTVAVTGGSRGEVTVWNLDSRQRGKALSGHDGAIGFLEFSADGALMASGSTDGLLLVWDTATWTLRQAFTDQRSPMTCAAFVANAVVVLPADASGGVLAYDIHTGSVTRRLAGTGDAVNCLAVEPGSGRIAGGTIAGDILLWAPGSMEPEHVFSSHQSLVIALRFFDNGGSRLLAAQQDSTMTSWRMDDNGVTSKFTGQFETVTAIALTRDGRTAAVRAEDGSLNLMPVTVGGDTGVLSGRHQHVRDIACSRDGNLIASVGDDNAFVVWDAATARPLAVAAASDTEIVAVRFTADDQEAVLALADGSVVVRNVASGNDTIATATAADKPTAAALSQTGRWRAAGFDDGAVELTDLNGASRRLVGQTASIRSLGFSSTDTCVVAIAADGAVMVWSTAGGEPIGRVAVADAVAACYSTGHSQLLVGDRSGLIWAFDGKTMERTRQFKVHYHEIQDLKFMPSGAYFLSTDARSNMKITEIATGRVLFSRYEPGGITSTSFSANGRKIISGGANGDVRVYDVSRAVEFLQLVSEVEVAQNRLATRPNDVRSLAVLADWYAFRQAWNWSLALYTRADYQKNDLPSLPVARCRRRLGDESGARDDYRRALSRNEASAGYLNLCLTSLHESQSGQ